MNDVTYGLIIEFEDESESYANGYRAGLIDSRMRQDESPINVLIENSNHGVYKQLCGHYGYSWKITDSDVGGWCYAEFIKSKPTLRVIK